MDGWVGGFSVLGVRVQGHIWSGWPWLARSVRLPPAHLPSYMAPCPPRAPPHRAGGGNQRDKGGAVAIRQSYLRVVGFQEDVLNGDTARRPTFTCACLAHVWGLVPCAWAAGLCLLLPACWAWRCGSQRLPLSSFNERAIVNPLS